MTTAQVAPAFRGDPDVKCTLLQRIDDALAAGALSFSPLREDVSDPVVASIDGGDPEDYARAYGYPLPLVTLLTLVATGQDEAVAVGFVRDWVAVVRPGADLSAVPSYLMLDILAVPELQIWRPDITQRLVSLHRAWIDGEPRAGDWVDVRRDVLTCGDTATDRSQRSVARLWEEACWPADSGRSVLAATFVAWRRLETFSEGWSDARENEAQAALSALWDECQPLRDAGEHPNYPALFQERHPLLAKGFEANLAAGNRRSTERAHRLAHFAIARLRSASAFPIV